MTGIFIQKPLDLEDIDNFSKFIIFEIVDLSCKGHNKEPTKRVLTADYQEDFRNRPWVIKDYESELLSLPFGDAEFLTNAQLKNIINNAVKKLKTHSTLWILGVPASKTDMIKRQRAQMRAKKTTARKCRK